MKFSTGNENLPDDRLGFRGIRRYSTGVTSQKEEEKDKGGTSFHAAQLKNRSANQMIQKQVNLDRGSLDI